MIDNVAWEKMGKGGWMKAGRCRAGLERKENALKGGRTLGQENRLIRAKGEQCKETTFVD